MSGIVMAPVAYQCRVCTSEAKVYVSPTEDEDGYFVIDAGGRHRLCTTECGVCDQERTCVILMDQNEATQ